MIPAAAEEMLLASGAAAEAAAVAAEAAAVAAEAAAVAVEEMRAATTSAGVGIFSRGSLSFSFSMAFTHDDANVSIPSSQAPKSDISCSLPLN